MLNIFLNFFLIFILCNHSYAATAAKNARRAQIAALRAVTPPQEEIQNIRKAQELKMTAVSLDESKSLYETKLREIEQKLRDTQIKLESSGTTTPGTGTYTPISEEQLKSIGVIEGVEGLTVPQQQQIFAQILNFKLLNESKKKIDDLVQKINDFGYSNADELGRLGHSTLTEIEAINDADAQNEPTVDILMALENAINDPSRHVDVKRVAEQLYLRVSDSISPETRKVFLNYVIEKSKMFSQKLINGAYLDASILISYGKKIIKEIESFKDEKRQESPTIDMLEALENLRHDTSRQSDIINAAETLYMIMAASNDRGTEIAHSKFIDIKKKNGMFAYLNDEGTRRRHEATLNRVKRDPDLFPTAYIMLIDPSYFSIPVSPSATQDEFNNVDKVQKNLYNKLRPTFRYLGEDILESIRYVVYQSYFIGGDAVKRDVANSYIDSINDALLQKKKARENRKIHDEYVSNFMIMKQEKNELERVGADTTGVLNKMEKLKADIIAKRKELQKESDLEAKRDELALKAPYAEIIPLIEKREKGIPSIESIKTTKGITDGAKAAKTPEEETEARKQETAKITSDGAAGFAEAMRKMKEVGASAGAGAAVSSKGSAAGGMADLLKRAKEGKAEKERKDTEKKRLKDAEEAEKVRLRNLESQRKEAEAYARLSGGLEDDDLDRREKERKAKSARPKMSFGGGTGGGSLFDAIRQRGGAVSAS